MYNGWTKEERINKRFKKKTGKCSHHANMSRKDRERTQKRREKRTRKEQQYAF